MDGNFFRQRRDELSKTQRDIALELDMTTSAISAWENGVSLPELAIVDRVAAIYQVTPARLFKEMKQLAQGRAALAAKERAPQSV